MRGGNRRRSALLFAVLAPLAHGAPLGGEVTAGSGEIGSSGTTLTVDQASGRLAINWQSFSIGADESVVFRQPSTDAIALNRILGQDPSVIQGNLTANGQVFLLNPNGVLFGANSEVDVGGLLASTLNLSNEDFLAGRYRLVAEAGSTGEVVNAGTLNAHDGGYVALAGTQVTNAGVIRARLGTVALGAGEQLTLNIDGRAMVNFSVDRAALMALVSNRSLLQAEGGTVVLTARARDAVLSNVINHTGIIEARSVSAVNGRIRLEGGGEGVVAVAGTLDASGRNAGETGGAVLVTGDKVALLDGSGIDVSGSVGGGTVRIGGGYQGHDADVENAKRTFVGASAAIRADALDAGDGGRVIVWSDGDTRYSGVISARGGEWGGDGGFVEVSGKQQLGFEGGVDTSAVAGTTGTLLLDPDDLSIAAAPVGGATADASNPFQAIDGVNDYYVLGTTLTALPGGSTVQLLANHDIVFQTNLAMATNAVGSLTLTAGNSIAMAGFNLSTANGNATLSAGAGGITNLGTINLGSAVLTLNSSGAITQNAGDFIQGSTSLVKQSSGTLTLSGANTYSGATTINGGTLQLAAANRIADGNVVTVGAGATFDLNGFAETIGSIAGAGNIALGSGTLVVGGNDASTTFSGAISGAGSITKLGSGVLTLSGTNTYSGVTTIVSGKLRASGGTAIGDASTVTLGNSAGTALELTANETIGNLSGGGPAGGNVTLAGNTLTVNEAGTTTYSGILTGTGGLTKQGAGTLTLAGLNTFSGTTTVDAGTLVAGTNNALSVASHLIVTGGTFSLTSHSDKVASVQLLGGSITGTTGVLSSVTAFDLQSGTVNATLGGTTGLNKSAEGTVTLLGATTYTGPTTISGGALQLGAANRIADGNVVTVLNGGAFDLNSFAETIGALEGDGNILLGSATLTVGGMGPSTTFAGSASGVGGLTKVGGGVLTLSGTSTYTGPTTINAGTLRVAGGSAISDSSQVTLAGSNGVFLDLAANETIGNLNGGGINVGNVTLNGNTLTVNETGTTTYLGIISGTGGLTKQGAGALTLTGVSAYTGTTQIDAGTLALGASNVLANASQLVVNGGTFALTTRSDTVAGVQLRAGSITGTTGVLTSTSAYDLQSGTVSGNLGGAAPLIKSTEGTVTLTTVSSASGTTINGGTLRLGAPNLIANNATVVLAGSGTLDLNNFAETIGSLEGTGNVALGSATLSLGGTGASSIYAGAISGTGGLTKLGTGTLTLAGTNTYSGVTTINAGTLRVAGGTALGDGAPVTLANGGVILDIATDETIGAITGAGSVVLGDSTLTMNIAGTSTFTGILSGSGGLTKQGAGTLTLTKSQAYTGITRISAGTFALGANNVLADESKLVVDGGTLALTTRNDTVAGVQLVSGAITGTTGILTSTTDYDLQSGTLNVNLAGAVALNKSSTGTVILTGANSYTGATSIMDGTLRMGAPNVIVDTSDVTVASGGTLDLNNLDQTLGSLAGAGNIVLGNATLLVGLNGNTTEFSGAVSGTGKLGKIGAGVLTLSGASTYSGATTIDAGTVVAASADAFGAITAGTTIADGATLLIANASLAAEPLTLNGTGSNGAGALIGIGNAAVRGAVLIGSPTAISAPTALDALTLSGTVNGVRGAASDLTQVGLGTVTFGGIVGATAPLASFTSAAGTTTRIDGNQLRTGNAQLYEGALVFGGAVVTLRTTNSDVTVNGVVSGSAGAQRFNTGTGAVTALNPANDFGGVLITSAGDVNLVDSNGLSLGTSSAGTLRVQALSGEIAVDGTITTTGTGDTIVLVSGGTFVNNMGATALNPGATGRWLVWSQDPGVDTRGDLVYAFKQYDAHYPLTPVAGSGNGFLYSVAPVVSVSLTGTVSKAYDGTSAATIDPSNFAVGNVLDGDIVTFNPATSGLYDNRNAGTGKNVSVSGWSITGVSNGAAAIYGYQFASGTASGAVGTITRRALLGGFTAASKAYDGSVAATITSRTLSGVLEGESVAYIGGLATFANKYAGVGKTVTATGLTLSGIDADNYTVNSTATTTADIDPIAITTAIIAVKSPKQP